MVLLGDGETSLVAYSADIDQWTDIRRRVLLEGLSKRQVLCETGMHWRRLEKALVWKSTHANSLAQ